MSRRRPSSLQEFSGINITPLMDLTFLLLIVFMITAPMLEYSVDVSPPRLDADRIDEIEHLLITLTRTGEVVIDGETMTVEQMAGRLADFFATRPDATVLIRGDEHRPYGEVMNLLRMASSAGFEKIALLTREEEG